MSKRTELHTEFLSVASLNPFIANTSSPRAVMDFNHLSQHLNIIGGGDKPLIRTGTEGELAKYIDHVCETDHDLMVLGVVPKYTYNESPSTIIFGVYEEEDGMYLDIIDGVTYKTHHTQFGYRLHPTEKARSLSHGSIINKGDILYQAESYDDGVYKYGVNANVAMMSHPLVSEDGFVISESFAKRARSSSIVKRVINVSKSTIPLNLYGKDSQYKTLPDIGEYIRDDGVLFGLRKKEEWFSAIDLSDKSLSSPDRIFDELFYAEPGSKVIDIEVVAGNNRREFPEAVTDQLDYWNNQLLGFYKRIVSKYEQIRNDYDSRFGEEYLKLTPRANNFITSCMVKAKIMSDKKGKLTCRRLPIDQYRIEITLYRETKPNIGHKLTDIHAAKGVGCVILPDSHMPVDDLGNVADVIVDNNSTISRMNIGRAYQSYISAFSRDNRQRLLAEVISRHGEDYLNNLDKEDLDYIRGYLRGMYALINSDMVEFLDGLDDIQLKEHFREIATDALYLYYPTDNERNVVDVIEDIKASPYKPHVGKLRYIDPLGNEVVTEESIEIGQLYFMVLEKIANSYTGVSSARVNSFGFPVKSSTKFRSPSAENPVKSISETEARIMTSYGGEEFIAEVMDSNLNNTTHKVIVQELLNADNPVSGDFDIDRTEVSYGDNRSLALFNHILAAAGVEIGYVDDETGEEK